jgi:hypothetical protein
VMSVGSVARRQIAAASLAVCSHIFQQKKQQDQTKKGEGRRGAKPAGTLRQNRNRRTVLVYILNH